MPCNATVSDADPTYADVVPPYPVDLDFDADVALPPSYASLDPCGPDAGPAGQTYGDASDNAPPMPQDAGWCACSIVGVLAVSVQLAGFLAIVYGDLGSYSPIGLR